MNPSLPMHIEVYTLGVCPSCNKQNRKKIFDYGELPYRELEEQMDKTNHAIEPLSCVKCGYEFFPQEMLYIDLIQNKEVGTVDINYADMRDHEDFHAVQEGHDRRHEVFQENESSFWSGFCQYAIENWRDLVNELNKDEIQAGYTALSIDTLLRTDGQARKDVLNRLKTSEEKASFWKAANHYFIYEHMLDLGPLAWEVNEDSKRFGMHRTRFVILHFPLDQVLERERTKYIGQVIKRNKGGDNDFLFRRISQLSQELERVSKRGMDFFQRAEQYKAEMAKLQTRLSEAHEKIRLLENSKTEIYTRNPDDIRKIKDLKGFVSELLNEVKSLRPKAAEEVEPIALEEEREFSNEEQNFWDPSLLQGRTIGIIGGTRARAAAEADICSIMTHDGSKQDVDFHMLLKQSDIIVVLTRFVSHASMWEAKAYAIEQDKPILFETAINIPRILQHCMQKLGHEQLD
ncbi:DUF2325 domain-containing protein [Paenibacillus alvei]|uniref:DUF2325 domain-containing protein n=1 Tax=Paenibacillus alvei TaxID=44250 RepID=UPI002281CF67|nr:DUF2325 domain-containing protein [Paenibacillus alvei]